MTAPPVSPSQARSSPEARVPGPPGSPGLPGPGSRRSSGVLATVCLLTALALPVVVAYYLCVSTPELLAQRLGVGASLHGSAPIAFWRRVLVVAAGVVPVALLSYGLLRARSCFQQFARGDYFTPRAISGLQGFSGGTFLAGVTGVFAAPLASLALTLGSGAGRSSITLNLGSHELLLMLFAAIVWQIAAALVRAAQLAEENAQFV